MSAPNLRAISHVDRPGTAVLCDWNGTLVDDQERAWAASAAAVAEYLPAGRIAPDRTATATAWCLPLSRFLTRLGVPAPDLRAAERTWNREMARRPVVARAGVADALRLLRERGVEVGVISAGSPELLVADLAATGLSAELDHLCAGVADKASVIAPFVERLGRGRVAYLGDTEEDLHAAARAGAIPLALAGGYRSVSDLRRAGPRAMIDRLTELPDVACRLFGDGEQATGGAAAH